MAQPIEENKAVQLIKAYLEQYPDEEWGFAHIILSDYNLEDEWLDEIIQKGKTLVAAGLPVSHTVEFLEQLHLIPEDERVIDFYGE